MAILTWEFQCAGLTMYSPLVYNGAGPGKKVGIVGLGGLVSVKHATALQVYGLDFASGIGTLWRFVCKGPRR